MGNKVVKFGGSSLADAGQFAKVREIIRADAARLFVVPSAPGKRFADDIKVTDMLYESQRLACAGEDFGPVFDRICSATWKGRFKKCGKTWPPGRMRIMPPAGASF